MAQPDSGSIAEPDRTPDFGISDSVRCRFWYDGDQRAECDSVCPFGSLRKLPWRGCLRALPRKRFAGERHSVLHDQLERSSAVDCRRQVRRHFPSTDGPERERTSCLPGQNNRQPTCVKKSSALMKTSLTSSHFWSLHRRADHAGIRHNDVER